MIQSILSAVPENTNLIAKFLEVLYNAIGNFPGSFAVTVIVFTLIFKLALTPIDVWQKLAQRKQMLATQRIKPKLEKLEKQYANKPDLLKQKQAELYRTEKGMGLMSTVGMCLPMILTMVFFFIVLSGFNAFVRFQNEMVVYNMAEFYNNALTTPTSAELVAKYAELTKNFDFLWIKNIFMPDTWASVVPTLKEFTGTGMGAISANIPSNVENIPEWYNTLFGPAMAEFNNNLTGFTGFFQGIGKWNGYLVLPLLSTGISIISTKVMQASSTQVGTSAQQAQSAKQQKFMMIVMPIMFGAFSLFYSSAFALYIFISNLFSTTFGVSFNLITKSIDKKRNIAAPLNANRR